jgi:hypothetical protein
MKVESPQKEKKRKKSIKMQAPQIWCMYNLKAKENKIQKHAKRWPPPPKK